MRSTYKGLSILSILGLLLGALPMTAVQADGIIRYAAPGGLTSGACDSWGNACELSYALKTASPGSEIWVKAGTYLPGGSSSDTFLLQIGVALYGGFQGNETRRNQANWYTHPTILSGDIAGDDLPDFTHMEENSRHVVTARDADATAELNGFYIRSGSAQGTGLDGLGGAVQVYNSSPTLKNLILSHNRADRGGGIGCYGNSTLTLSNIQYEKNLALSGGGLGSEAGCVVYQFGAVFNSNQADAGGAIYNNASTLILINASISGNTASTVGGGIANNLGTLLIGNSILWNNHLQQGLDQISSPASANLFTFQNIIQGGSAGSGDRDVDPQFAENPTSGADQTWGTADDTPGNLMLRYDSPAIDTGNSAFIKYLPSRDLRNWPRIIDHPRPDTPVGPIVDQGGYEAGIIFTREGAAGRQDGSSWQDAFSQPQDAMAFTHAGDEVWASAGTYRVGADRSGTFLLKNDVAVYGGFTGTETFRAERNWTNHISVLSGLTAPGGAKAYHVVTGVNVNASAVLDGFTIQDGNADGAQAPDNQGGGIYLRNASPTLQNLMLAQNAAVFGGGMFITSSPASALVNLSFLYNQAEAGGGLYLDNVNQVMNQLTFKENQAISGQGEGGGLYSLNAGYSLADSIFLRNAAINGGGIANTGASTPRLVNMYFYGNAATSGGGMYNLDGASPDISNAIFVGNRASNAGAVYNENLAAPVLRNVTMVSNPGGAFYAKTNDAAQEPLLVNVIGWDNTASPIVTQNSLPSIKYSLLEGSCPKQLQESCLNILSSDPLFAQMPNIGPDNVWGTADDNYGNLHLTLGSKAIDAGMNGGVAPWVTTDIEGRPRFIDEPSTPDTGLGTGPIVDMGAYETRFAASTTQILSVTAEPSYAGQPVVVHFQVSGTLGPASGTVQVTDGIESCSAPAAQGQCSLVFKIPGQKSLVAHFLGDAVYDASDSEAFVHQVNPIPTTITLTLDPMGMTGVGRTVHASFAVSPTPADITAYLPDGTVTVSSESASCSAAVVQGGCDLVFANPGVYTVTATYSGNTFFGGKSSDPIPYEVQALRATQITLVVSPEVPTPPGKRVHAAFSVSVTDPLGGTATGKVTVTDGKDSCQASLVGGQGACDLPLTGIGTHQLVAIYQGEGVYGPSTSATVTHQVMEVQYFPYFIQ